MRPLSEVNFKQPKSLLGFLYLFIKVKRSKEIRPNLIYNSLQFRIQVVISNRCKMHQNVEKAISSIDIKITHQNFYNFQLIFFGYITFNGSIYRTINGVDDCGNICGRDNNDNGLQSCGVSFEVFFLCPKTHHLPFYQPHDMRSLTFLKLEVSKDPHDQNITIIHKKCVKNCYDFPNYKEINNRCRRKNATEVVESDDDSLEKTWSSMLITCVVALVFSYILLMLLRYATKYVIWIIYIGIVVLLAIGSIITLLLFFKFNEAYFLLVVSGVLALLAIVLSFILYFAKKRIRLVVLLFKEASKALIDVPLIIFEPLLTLLALGLSCAGFIYFMMLTDNSGSLKVLSSDGEFERAIYEKTPVLGVAFCINLVAFLWFTSFIFGCQHFIVAGTVSQWYFTRNKKTLDSPIRRSFSYLLRFHIGSVCFGSLLITLVRIIRIIIAFLKVS